MEILGRCIGKSLTKGKKGRFYLSEKMHLSLSSYSWSLHTENPDNYHDFEFRCCLSLSLSLSRSRSRSLSLALFFSDSLRDSKVKNRSCSPRAALYGDKKADRYPFSPNPGLPSSSLCRFNRSISLIPATASCVRSTAQTCHSSSRAVRGIYIREINARCQSWFIFIVLHYALYYFQLHRVSFYLFVLQDDSGNSSLLFPIETTRRWFHLFFATFRETFFSFAKPYRFSKSCNSGRVPAPLVIAITWSVRYLYWRTC